MTLRDSIRQFIPRLVGDEISYGGPILGNRADHADRRSSSDDSESFQLVSQRDGLRLRAPCTARSQAAENAGGLIVAQSWGRLPLHVCRPNVHHCFDLLPEN